MHVPLLAMGDDQFIYTTNNGTLTISEYTGPGGLVEIPSTVHGLQVTSIGDWAFGSNVTAVTLPDGITNIAEYAFSDSDGLSSILVDPHNPVFSSLDGVVFDKSQTTILLCPEGKQGDYAVPTTVTSIAERAFIACRGLTNVTIPSTVTNIGSGAFGWCSSLKAITIPAGVVTLGDSLFIGCSALTAIKVDSLNTHFASLDGVLFDKSFTTLLRCPEGKPGEYVIPSTVAAIGWSALTSCTLLTNVIIPDSVTNIASWSFYECVGLSAVTIPRNVLSVGWRAFDACTNLHTIQVADLNPSYRSQDGVLFSNALTSLVLFPPGKSGAYSIPGTVTNIEINAFYRCPNLTSVTIPGSLGSLKALTFIMCDRMTNAVIANGVTNIETEAFSSCKNLSTVSLPASVTSIQPRPFANCFRLAAINVDSLNPAYASDDGVLFDKTRTTLVLFPQAKTGDYSIPNTVTNVATEAFSHCMALSTVTIPATVQSLGDRAFFSCLDLRLYFRSNAPAVGAELFGEAAPTAIVYYVPGTTGWGPSFEGVPTSPWLPQIRTDDPGFGIHSNGMGFNVAWASGQTIVVEATTNLSSPTWFPLHTNTLTSDLFYFNDPGWANAAQRFYRVSIP